ncbi:DUF2293 domain-containing protein [Actinokineospora fastidiosa]|uniref:DUF2293 domain-containing protein n=1 Tax=Actinokineospora fastidiosa TaxID=1816 RepID=A0A918LHQ2_9PSEU|nr:DUF2293 domain-containing protein [Actinokineospora fastidiosa]GGS51036.1 hypothetical protein GCM10010171_52820 [Actinokineospora fastidiosa]
MTALSTRVRVIAEELVRRKGTVAPIDVLTGLGWLSARTVESWRQGRVPRLDAVAAVPPERLAEAVGLLREWASARGLHSSEVDYVAATLDARPLRFGDDDRPFRTHWTDPDLSPARRARIEAKAKAVPDPVALRPDKRWHCSLCRETGDFHFVEDDLPVCLACADMDHLVFLPSGDAALTRRARAASGLAAVVMTWHKPRKRFIRCGTLVERAALETAEEQCLADEDARERRRVRDRARRELQDLAFTAAFSDRIAELFPGLAAARAQAIAEHASVRSSGRVGRSAAGQALDEHAVTLAVVAAIRHEETDYDAMLMAGVPRAVARERIRERVDAVLTRWRQATLDGDADQVSQSAVDSPA